MGIELGDPVVPDAPFSVLAGSSRYLGPRRWRKFHASVSSNLHFWAYMGAPRTAGLGAYQPFAAVVAIWSKFGFHCFTRG